MEFIVYHDGKIIDTVRAGSKQLAQAIANARFKEPVAVVHYAADQGEFKDAERQSIERLALHRQEVGKHVEQNDTGAADSALASPTARGTE